MVIIGIDPGQHCGLAVCQDGRLAWLGTCEPFELAAWLDGKNIDRLKAGMKMAVVFEDSRLQSYVWNAAGKSRADGALRIARNLGQVDAICAMVQAWATFHGVPFISVSPKAKGSKMDAATFSRFTGWQGRSNQHERDAAALAWRYRWMRSEPQNQSKRAHKARTAARCYVDSYAPQNAPKRETEALPDVCNGCGFDGNCVDAPASKCEHKAALLRARDCADCDRRAACAVASPARCKYRKARGEA